MMKIYNTLTRQKEEFIPLVEGKVSMYSCGPTVYNYFHIGNARPFITFDTLRRYFEYRGYDVTFVQNFTDIDDKMINRANEEGITVKQLADRFIKEYFTDAKALNIKPATVHPKATEHIPEIIELVQKLVNSGKAYEVNGDVYFSTVTDPEYGKLSGQDIQDLRSGARVDVNEIKRDPLDFALWKAEKPGEPSWDSPWGKGRPGWHIECSAMSMKYLGESFDIHGGGQDLIFPHHENEIAQSECATCKTFARYWMHNGYINIDNRKMSKSLGNFFTVREVSEEFDMMAVRLFMLSAHYRNPINYSRELIEQANSALIRMRNCEENLCRIEGLGLSQTEQEVQLTGKLEEYRARFIEAMDDDLNTADALGVLFDLVRDANIAFHDSGSPKGAKAVRGLLEELCDVLGILLKKEEEEIPAEILEMAEQRKQARLEKNYALSDELRDRAKEMGYLFEDTKQGQVIKPL